MERVTNLWRCARAGFQTLPPEFLPPARSHLVTVALHLSSRVAKISGKACVSITLLLGVGRAGEREGRVGVARPDPQMIDAVAEVYKVEAVGLTTEARGTHQYR